MNRFICQWLVIIGLVTARDGAADVFLLEAVREIESFGGKIPTGDKGKANGDWHMHRLAWEDVSIRRRQSGLKVFPYAQARVYETARLYAAEYLTICRERFAAGAGRAPTDAEVYATWNLGAAVFGKKYKWELVRTPARRRQRAEEVANLADSLRQAAAVSSSKFLVQSSKGEKLNHGWTLMNTDGEPNGRRELTRRKN